MNEQSRYFLMRTGSSVQVLRKVSFVVLIPGIEDFSCIFHCDIANECEWQQREAEVEGEEKKTLPLDNLS